MLIVVSQSGCNLYFLISVYFCLFYPVFDWISTGTDIPSNFKDIYEYPDVRFVQQNVLYLITTVLPVNDTTHVRFTHSHSKQVLCVCVCVCVCLCAYVRVFVHAADRQTHFHLF